MFNDNRQWRFSLIDFNDFGDLTIPAVNSNITFYSIEGKFRASVLRVYDSRGLIDSPTNNDGLYIALKYPKRRHRCGCCGCGTDPDDVEYESHMPVSIIIRVGPNAYATLAATSVDYIDNLIEILKTWKNDISVRNISILEKGFC